MLFMLSCSSGTAMVEDNTVADIPVEYAALNADEIEKALDMEIIFSKMPIDAMIGAYVQAKELLPYLKSYYPEDVLASKKIKNQIEMCCYLIPKYAELSIAFTTWSEWVEEQWHEEGERRTRILIAGLVIALRLEMEKQLEIEDDFSN